MTEPTTSRRAGEGGFTLVEMMVAIGILVFGLSTLIGVMTLGAGTRRNAEQRTRSVLLSDQIRFALEQEAMAHAAIDLQKLLGYEQSGDLGALAIEPLTDASLDGYPGLRYSVDFVVDPQYPKLALARVKVTWLAQGERVGQTFDRILVRSKPFNQRVADRRNAN